METTIRRRILDREKERDALRTSGRGGSTATSSALEDGEDVREYGLWVMFGGLLLYTCGVLFRVEWCIKQP